MELPSFHLFSQLCPLSRQKLTLNKLELVAARSRQSPPSWETLLPPILAGYHSNGHFVSA